jgi:hypothetical protein
MSRKRSSAPTELTVAQVGVVKGSVIRYASGGGVLLRILGDTDVNAFRRHVIKLRKVEGGSWDVASGGDAQDMFSRAQAVEVLNAGSIAEITPGPTTMGALELLVGGPAVTVRRRTTLFGLKSRWTPVATPRHLDQCLDTKVLQAWPGASAGKFVEVKTGLFVQLPKPSPIPIDPEPSLSLTVLKSIIQKIIRFRPKLVDGLDAETQLRHYVRLAYTHPGSFNPSISKFTSGREATSKRLAVIDIEDAHSGKRTAVHRALALALVYRTDCTVGCDAHVLGFLQNMAVACWKSATALIYNKQQVFVADLGSEHVEQRCSAMMDTLGSFKGDLGMFKYVALARSRVRTSVSDTWHENMPLCHAYDQHCAPVVAYLDDQARPERTATPYKSHFGRLFKGYSGFNPRRTKSRLPAFHLAQPLARALMSPPTIKPTGPDEVVVEIRVRLQKAWLAGTLGTFKVGDALVFLAQDCEPTAVYAPRRGLRDSTLPKRLYTRAVRWFINRLKTTGLDLKCPYLPSLHGQTVKMREHDEQLTVGGELWSKVVEQVTLDVPICEPIATDLATAVQVEPGFYIQADADTKAVELFDALAPGPRRRLLGFLRGSRASIDFPAIGMRGGGTEAAVTVHDGAVFRTLLRLGTLYPGAIGRGAYACRFKVLSPPLLWHVHTLLSESQALEPEEKKDEEATAPNYRVLECQRTPFPYQQRALERMQQSSTNFIYATVGAGKTYMVILHLLWLMETGDLPPYVIFCLPKSAIPDVMAEFKRFFRDVCRLVPLKSAKTSRGIITTVRQMRKRSVTFIEHDHLRRVCDELCTIGPYYACIDEVHKAVVSNTLRSQVCLQLTGAAAYWTVMTGTPVLNDNVLSLAPWLQPLCGYPVTKSNIFVAMSSMNAHIVDTGVKVADEEVRVDGVEQDPEYKALAPPGLGGDNKEFFGARDLLPLLRLNWGLLDTEMVGQTVKYRSDRVYLVARDRKHQATLMRLLTAKGVQCVVMETGFTTTRHTEVVIGRTGLSEGFTMCFAGTMVTGVYLTNQATRDQLRGRINRVSQARDSVLYVTVHGGVLSKIHDRHQDAASIAAICKALALD